MGRGRFYVPLLYAYKERILRMMLYIHIPFCIKKCDYCDFVSFACRGGDFSRYVDALIDEMERRPCAQMVTSIFLGGGTPSLLPAGELSRLLAAVRKRYTIARRCEITSEANPGTVAADWLDAAVDGGVNRLSVGVQSVQPHLLEAIGRVHDFGQVCTTFERARAAGLHNLSADLMYALPGQTLGQWKQSLEQVVQLAPVHLSCYALTVAEGTPFGQLDAQGKLPRPCEDEEMDMQAATAGVLAAHGLYQYEVSNYAKPGYACQHNVGYWTRAPYIGLGCAAHSLQNGQRLANTVDLDAYMQGAPFASVETLAPVDAAFEEMMLGLRMVEGVTLSPRAWTLFGAGIDKMRTQGLMIVAQNRVKLSPRGFDVMNAVLTELMP